MKDKNDLGKELEGLSPLLRKLKEQDLDMKVPGNYFKELPEKVLSQVRETNQPQIQTQRNHAGWFDGFLERIQWILQPRVAMAFSLMLLLAVAGVVVWKYNQKPSEVQIAEIDKVSSEEVLNYLQSNIEDFDTGLLLELELTDQHTNFLNELDLEESEINNYLQDNLDDIDHKTLENLF